MSDTKKVLEFLKQNKGYGFRPCYLAKQLNINESNLWNVCYRYKDQIETIKVNQREIYYLAK